MKNKTMRFLIISIACIIPLCVLTFSYTTYRMNRKGAAAIGSIGATYMEGMSEQAAENFGTTIDLRLSQVGALADSVAPERYPSAEAARVALSDVAKRRSFTHLALYGGSGKVEMLYGHDVDAQYEAEFFAALERGERVMGKGIDDAGRVLVIMGVPAKYTLTDGTTSIALLAALPISYVSDSISLGSGSDLMFYYVIDHDGGIVTSDRETEETDFFELAKKNYVFENGTVEHYITELKEAMAAGESCTGVFTLGGERCYQYAVSLPSSDWYLMLSMPYGQMDQTVDNLGRSWRIASITSCIVVIFLLLVVFLIYLVIARKHVREIEQAQLAAVRANKAKSEFLSNMSHDIRTPMNAIVGMTAIAKANADDPEQVRSCLNKIDLSSRHLLNLINDILDMSKIESGKLELHFGRTSLKETIRSVVNIVQPQADARRQTFEANYDSLTHDSVMCDSLRFSQILVNLLGNAVKFTPQGGNVWLTCTEEASPLGEGHSRIRVLVKDNGIGMTEEFRLRIFDAFAREDNKRVQKTEGSGLGMAITKYIVDAMQGTIEVRSEPGVGSEFEVVLDFGIAEEGAGEEIAIEAGEIDFTGKKVLIAEDNDLNREIAVELLSDHGLTIETAENGRICADKFAASEIGGYDAILMDIRMPIMDGYEATRTIRTMPRADAATIPIIAMSADAFSEDVQRCLDCGMNAHTPKPIDVDAVFALLMKFIGNNDNDARKE